MFRCFIVVVLSALIAACGGGSSGAPVSSGPPGVASLTIDHASTATYRDALTVLTRHPVTLSTTLAGESSTLAQGTTFEWSLVAKPSGSAAQIRERTEALANQFVPDLAGVYTAQVVVNQAGVRSQPRAIVLRAVPVQIEFIVDAVPEGDNMVVRVHAGTENAPNQHCFLFGAGRCRPLSVQGELDAVPLGEFTATQVARSDGAGTETVFVRTFDAQMLGSDWHGLRIIVSDEPPTRQEAFIGLHAGVAARAGVVASLLATDTPPRLDMPTSVRTGETVTASGTVYQGGVAFFRLVEKPEGSTAALLPPPEGRATPLRTFVADKPGRYTVEYASIIPFDPPFPTSGLSGSTHATVIAVP